MEKTRKETKGFKYKNDFPPKINRKRLQLYLIKVSDRIRNQLRNWLAQEGREVRITGGADPDSQVCTLTFADSLLGTVGKADLVFKGMLALPSEVRCRVYAGPGVLPGVAPDVEARRELMKKIHAKTEELFVVKISVWRATYHSGDEQAGELEITDADITRVKQIAWHSAPPGTDMIRLVTPDGCALIRTAKKRWVRER